jgi:RNA polymerase sigma factor (sigma-70 family)
MSQTQAGVLLQHLRKLGSQPTANGTSDRELLRCFTNQSDEAAFALLIRRHGPMVLRVCQRLLHNWHDAEDVCQVTFLVLASRAASRSWEASVASWLHQVAYHLALKARRAAARRGIHERQVRDRPVSDPLEAITGRELRTALDEELARLPAKFRAPLLLCYLEGATCDEAARQLDCPLGTLKSRLERGRELLGVRLVKRGLGLTSVLAAAVLVDNPANAALFLARSEGLARGALTFTGLKPGTMRAVSGRALGFAETALKSMALTRLKLVATLLLAVGVFAAGAGAVAYRSFAAGPPTVAEQQGPMQLPEERNEPKAETGKPGHTDQQGDPLPDGALLRLGTVRLRHFRMVNSVAFSPDGKVLASAGWDNTIRLWDSATAKELLRLQGHTDAVWCVAFAPNGKTLVSGGNDGMVRIWEVATGRELRSFQALEANVYCIAISPDGKILATGSPLRRKTLALWDLATGKELFAGTGSGVLCVAFSPDGKILAAGSDLPEAVGKPPPGARPTEVGDFPVQLWDVSAGQELRTLEGHAKGVAAIAFAPDGKRLASASYDSTIRFWDPATGRQLLKVAVPAEATAHFLGEEGGVHAVAFSPDGKALASAGFDGRIRLWDAATGRETRTLAGHARGVRTVAFSPDGKTLASGSFDFTIRLWDPATGKPLHSFPGHDGPVHILTCSPDGKLIASAGHDRTVRLWDRATGQELRVLQGCTDHLSALAFSPDSKLVASVTGDRVVHLWDTAGGEEVGLHEHSCLVRDIAFSPNGNLLATLCKDTSRPDSSVHLWEPATGKELHSFPGEEGGWPLHFSPDGKILGVCLHSGVQLLDMPKGKELRRFDGAGEFALSSDGNTLIARGEDRLMHRWDIPSGRELSAFGNPDEEFLPVLSPDGKTLVRITAKGTVRLWEVATGKERRLLDGHGGGIVSAAFSPDGRTLFTGSMDTSILAWNVARSGPSPDGELSDKELRALWQDLAGDDAVRADQAIGTLAAAPGQALPFLRRHLEPVAAADPLRLTRLVSQLDSEQFDARDSATRELRELRELAATTLRDTLTGKPPAEVQRRVEGLLRELDGPMMASDRLRDLRAIEVLERTGTSEARQLLAALSKGVPEARLTQEAKAALARLARRTDSSP